MGWAGFRRKGTNCTKIGTNLYFDTGLCFNASP